jgi:hypothetical protein
MASLERPFPVVGGQVAEFLSDDFASLNTNVWDVSGTPSVSSSELTLAAGQALLSRQGFQPPCLIEAVCTMTDRASGDDFRIGFYTDDNNLVEWRATEPPVPTWTPSCERVALRTTRPVSTSVQPTASTACQYLRRCWRSDMVVPDGQLPDNRNEVYRIREHGIPNGPFRVRLAGLATGGSSQLKVHRVQAYQLADIIVPGALGHHVDGMAIPVRLTNTPFVASPTNTALGAVQVTTDVISALAANAVQAGSNRSPFTEQAHVQAYFSGDQPFTCWLEAQLDGSNWVVIWYGSSTDATTDGVTRYYAVSPILQCMGGRNYRVKVRNGGSSAGNFRASISFAIL